MLLHLFGQKVSCECSTHIVMLCCSALYYDRQDEDMGDDEDAGDSMMFSYDSGDEYDDDDMNMS